MKKLTKTEKIWNDGEVIYDKFCSNFGIEKVATPRTNTLELFYLLRQKGETELLIREMMSEFMSNLTEEKVVVKDKKLYFIEETLKEF